MQHIQLGNICLDVIQKDIKNLHLSVYPPNGKVRISAPQRMDIDTIRVYAISKLSWIKRQQEKLRNQEREAPRDFLTRESHYFLGKRYLMKVIETNASNTVKLKHSCIELYVKPNTNTVKRKAILDEWYRERLKVLVPVLISKWEKIINLTVNQFAIKRMKTKWGTCNTEAKRIWLNLELAKKPLECLEYIVVHEMIHLIERKHNDKFTALLNQYYPQWKSVKAQLNRLPIGN